MCKENVTSIGWTEIRAEFLHVRAIFMQKKGLVRIPLLDAALKGNSSPLTWDFKLR